MDAVVAWPPFRVLCVDDNPDVADSEALLLQAVGFEAQACYDGPKALEVAAKFRPSVCLLDLQMPGMDGDEVAIRLQAETWCPLLLVAVTARSDAISRERTSAAGFHVHLVKPVDPQKLVEVVDALFRQADAVRRAQLS